MAPSTTSDPGPFMELLGRVVYEANTMRPLLPTYVHLIVSALFPIWIAAHSSLNRPPSAVKPTKKKDDDADLDDGDDEAVQKIENLTPSDAILFPILAGCTLASLYFILKWLQDPAWLNWALGIYFSWVGLFFAFKFLKDLFVLVRSLLFPTTYSARGQLWTVDLENRCYKSGNDIICTAPFPGLMRHLRLPAAIEGPAWSFRSAIYTKARLDLHIHRLLTVKTAVSLLDIASLITASSIVAYNTFIDKPWYLTNFLGFAFCYGGLQFTSPTTGWTGTLVLAALFFYDIYFVFFTPMMVTVATKLDVPIKLLFPRPDGCVLPIGAAEGSIEMEQYLECIAKKRTMAMLGLGDIVVPGIMIAFALRFDLYLHYLAKQKTSKNTKTTKPEYLPATGGWGERLWTTRKFQSEKLRAKSFKKTYFNATVFGYVAGMVTTVIVMQVAEHAQPALLYLVPGVLGMFWGTALVTGNLKTLWHYTEGDEEESDTKTPDRGDGEKVALTSESHDEAAADTNTNINAEANGTSEKSDDTKKPASEKTGKTQKTTKIDPEDTCRKLIEFSITLPDRGAGASKQKKKPKSPAGEDDSNGDLPNARKAIKTRDVVQDEDSQEDALETSAVRSRYNLRQASAGLSGARDVSEEPAVKRRKKA